MPEGRIPPDAAAQALVDVYRDAERRVARMVRLAIARGLDPDRVGDPDQQRGDASAAYWKRQHQMIRQQLRALEGSAPIRAAAAVDLAYRAGATAADVLTIGAAAGAGTFSGIHRAAVETIAGNLAGPLAETARRAQVSVADVFARAQALEGALSPAQLVPGVDFLGRRVPDAVREATLREVAVGLASGASRRDVTRSLAMRLIDEGVVDAVTGFVDARGARWSLGRYAEMATRTTTREAVVRGTVNRLRELPGPGTDLVTVSSHPHAADECTPYDGNTYSLDGRTPDYEILGEMPPYHPNCRHVLMPATAGFDEYVQALGVDQAPPPAPAPAPEDAPAPAPSPPIAPSAPAQGDKVTLTGGVDAKTGKPVGRVTGKVIETKGDVFMVQAGSARSPRWVQARTADIDTTPPPPKKRTLLPDPPAQTLRPVTSDPVEGNAAMRLLRDAQTGRLSPTQRAAVKAYVSGSADTGSGGWATKTISRKLRLSGDLTARQRQYVADLDAAFANVPPTEEPLFLHRGVDTDKAGRSRLGEVGIGDVIEDAGFTSTSTSRAIAEEFAHNGGDLIEVVTPAGARVIDVNAHQSSGFGREREVLLGRGSKLRVDGVRYATVKGRKHRVIRCTLVG